MQQLIEEFAKRLTCKNSKNLVVVFSFVLKLSFVKLPLTEEYMSMV
tara:strand:+ start:236 stop:373 length:138 start_codon:yes stop_codon:yes gene_type:complete